MMPFVLLDSDIYASMYDKLLIQILLAVKSIVSVNQMIPYSKHKTDNVWFFI